MSLRVTDTPPDYACKVCDFCGLRSDSERARRNGMTFIWHVRVYANMVFDPDCYTQRAYDYCSIACMRKDCARRTGTIHCESRATGLAEPRCRWCDWMANSELPRR